MSPGHDELGVDAVAELNDQLEGFVLVNVEPGRSPRVVLDFQTECVPGPWIQLFYMKAGIGLVRRDEQERFLDGHEDGPTGLVVDEEYRYHDPDPRVSERVVRLEDAFRTIDRRTSLIASFHEEYSGTYELRRFDSALYILPVERPHRPTFLQNVGAADLFWLTGELWRTSFVVGNYDLRVEVDQHVDEIYVEARDTYPGGYLPDWPVQNQSFAPVGGIGATGFHDFTFSVSHGGLTMSPCAFRARTRIGTCYSEWRYFIAAVQDFSAGYPIFVQSIDCNRDDQVSWNFVPLILFEVSRYFRPLNPCLDVVPPPTGDTYFREGGHMVGGGAFTWVRDWSVAKRTIIFVSFYDEDGNAFGFFQLGGVFGSAGSGAGGPDAVHNRQIPDQFP